MSASRPEAESEYSRGHRRSGAVPGTSSELSERPSGAAAALARIGGVVGAGLLVAAELTTVYSIHSSPGNRLVVAVAAGPHHDWALLPLAALAAALSVARRRGPARGSAPALAVGALALVALGIAVIVDLPDARSSGLIGHAGGRYVAAAASAGPGLYLETLGAVVLLVAAALGLLSARRLYDR